MLEKKIEKWMRQEIAWMDGQFYKWVSPGQDGVPDRICVMPFGHVYFVELKTDKGQLSEVQKYQHRRLERLGCNVVIIRGMGEAAAFIQKIKEEKIADELRATRLSRKSYQ